MPASPQLVQSSPLCGPSPAQGVEGAISQAATSGGRCATDRRIERHVDEGNGVISEHRHPQAMPSVRDTAKAGPRARAACRGQLGGGGRSTTFSSLPPYLSRSARGGRRVRVGPNGQEIRWIRDKTRRPPEHGHRRTGPDSRRSALTRSGRLDHRRVAQLVGPP